MNQIYQNPHEGSHDSLIPAIKHILLNRERKMHPLLSSAAVANAPEFKAQLLKHSLTNDRLWRRHSAPSCMVIPRKGAGHKRIHGNRTCRQNSRKLTAQRNVWSGMCTRMSLRMAPMRRKQVKGVRYDCEMRYDAIWILSQRTDLKLRNDTRHLKRHCPGDERTW